MALENRKQIVVVVIAALFGLIAVAIGSNWAQSKINAETAALAEQYEAKQKELAAQMQQRSDQQVAALSQEIQKVRAEQADMMQKQMAAFQAQQQAQAQAAPKLKRSKVSLALKTPEGKRAVTVMIDSLGAVGGLLNAGDFVDVIAHLNVPNPDATTTDKKKTITAMIFQNLQVLAVNTNLDDPGAYDDQQSAPTLKVTFAVDPQEAGLLSFSNLNGKLELALRSPQEQDKQTVKASTWKTLADYVLQNQGANLQVPDDDDDQDEKPVENKPSIQIFRGGKEL